LATDDAKRLGNNIETQRRRLGLSRAALARSADLGLDTLFQIETGRRGATVTTLLKLADALEVQPGDLLRGLRR
jgi:transcriptional regulator with XRE-family HTH domain